MTLDDYYAEVRKNLRTIVDPACRRWLQKELDQAPEPMRYGDFIRTELDRALVQEALVQLRETTNSTGTMAAADELLAKMEKN